MIPQREINAWREHAPWSKDGQIEQDLLITQCMVAIFEDEILRNNLAMRGGALIDCQQIQIYRPKIHIQRLACRTLVATSGRRRPQKFWYRSKSAQERLRVADKNADHGSFRNLGTAVRIRFAADPAIAITPGRCTE